MFSVFGLFYHHSGSDEAYRGMCAFGPENEMQTSLLDDSSSWSQLWDGIYTSIAYVIYFFTSSNVQSFISNSRDGEGIFFATNFLPTIDFPASRKCWIKSLCVSIRGSAGT